MNRSHRIRTYRIGRYGLRNSKIRNFYLSVLGNNNILWFDIAMDNSRCMCCADTAAHLNRNTDRLFMRKSSLSLYIFF